MKDSRAVLAPVIAISLLILAVGIAFGVRPQPELEVSQPLPISHTGQPRTKDFYAQWDGEVCIDEVRWHWGLGELDESVAVDPDACQRRFVKRHTFKATQRRMVWVAFCLRGEELDRSSPTWVSP